MSACARWSLLPCLLLRPLSRPPHRDHLLAHVRLLSALTHQHRPPLLHLRPLFPTVPQQSSYRLLLVQSKSTTAADPKDTKEEDMDLETASGQQEEEPVDPDDPSGESAIYKGILATQIKLVKTFSLLTSVIGLSFQPVLYLQAQSGQNVGLILTAGAFFSFFTFATPMLIHWVSKKYVTELYYNKMEDSYTAITYSILVRQKKLKFRLQDVQVPDIPGMFTTFKVRNVPLFVDGQQFFAPQHYGKIMGYDKPLNLRWPKDEISSEKRKVEEAYKDKHE